MHRVVVVGHNVRNVAESARKAGYEVFAITKYVDADLKLYAEARKVENVKSKELAKIVDEVAEDLNAEVVLTSGCEDLPVRSEVLGTNPRVARDITNKLRFYRVLEKAGIPFPEITNDPPCIMKPIKGGGGLGIYLANDKADPPEGYLCQRYVKGLPCSVSLLAIDRRNGIKPLAVNKILVGWREMNARDFIYCGNLTPLILSKEQRDLLVRTAIDVVELFDVVGSVGVDFVLADKPYVLELNPRFQGSLDSIEWSYDVNLFDLHVKACEGKDFEISKPRRFACRAILFSDGKTRIKYNLTGNAFFADIPNVGEIIEKGDPIISILASSESEEDVFGKILQRKALFYRLAL